MKTQIIFLCVLGVIALVSCAPHAPFSGQREATPEEIKMVESQMPCVLNEGPCSEIGLRAKNVLPEVLKTGNCLKCTPEVNANIQRTLFILHSTELSKYLIPLRNLYGDKQTYNHNSN